MKKILVLDNYDSFTYNLVHLLQQLKAGEIAVHRNDKIALGEVANFDYIVLSPGPGIPKEAGIMSQVVQKYSGQIPILGVCLGHQCIAEEFGGTLYNLPKVVHGKRSKTTVVDPSDPLFDGVTEPFDAGRYHSWAVEESSFPESLRVTARTEDGVIMAFRHREFPIWGVQFHPESVLTEVGPRLMQNWLAAVSDLKSPLSRERTQ